MMVYVSLDSPSCEVTLLILYSVVYRDVTRQAKGLYRLKHVGALRNGLAYLSRYNLGWFCHSNPSSLGDPWFRRTLLNFMLTRATLRLWSVGLWGMRIPLLRTKVKLLYFVTFLPLDYAFRSILLFLISLQNIMSRCII
jgi:hypothetical protein